MFTRTQLKTMLELQSSINAAVDPDWLTAGHPYLRAIVVEGVEAMEHHGWKWWKRQDKNLPQLQIELADIWHFALSATLVDHSGDIGAAMDHVDALLRRSTGIVWIGGDSYEISEQTTVGKLELMVALAALRQFSLQLFLSLLADCSMTTDDLYRQYVGKNILNRFRVDHGYKTGEYQKIWAGKEDNERLIELMENVNVNSVDFPTQLYESLATCYAVMGGA